MTFKTIRPKSESPVNDFEQALTAFVDTLQTRINAYYTQHYTNLTPPTITTESGSKYVRIVLNDSPGASRSVHSFVRKSDGAILKAAGWKTPAKHVRGSIFADDHGMSAVSVNGANYLR